MLPSRYAINYNAVLSTPRAQGGADGGGAGRALADFVGQLACKPGIFRLRHQSQRLDHTLVRKQAQKRRLLQLCRQPLPQRTVSEAWKPSFLLGHLYSET
jgi:hypothetical protein